jgi:hypothetical protein
VPPRTLELWSFLLASAERAALRPKARPAWRIGQLQQADATRCPFIWLSPTPMRHRPSVTLYGRFSADVFRKPKWTLVGIGERMLCFSAGPDSNGTRCSVPVFTDRPAVVFWRWELINFRMIMLCHIKFSSFRDGARKLCSTYSCFGTEVGAKCSFFPSRGCLLESHRLLWVGPG